MYDSRYATRYFAGNGLDVGGASIPSRCEAGRPPRDPENDEDLYGQGHWPSRFNDDHKYTFTMCKSWSPESIHVIDFVRALCNPVSPISIFRIDFGVQAQPAEWQLRLDPHAFREVCD